MTKEQTRKVIEPGKWRAEIDENGNFTKVVYYDSYRRLLGFEKDEASNTEQAWTERVHPDDMRQLEEQYAEVMKKHPEGMDYDVEYRMLTKSGYRWFHDYGHCTRREDGSLAVCDGVVFDIQDIVDKEDAHQVLIENNLRMLALEDDFEALYDVELDTGRYSAYIKGETFNESIQSRLLKANEYFSDLRANIDAVIYPEDRDELYNILNREALRRTLAEKSHIDHYYRVMVDDVPVWFKVRVVYKDAEKRNVIIGAFNAEAEMVAKRQAEQGRNELIAQMAGGESLYIVNPATERFRILRQNDYLAANYQSDETFSESISRYIATDVFGPDRQLATEKLSVAAMVSHLEHDKEYIVHYRDFSTGVPHWYEMRAVRLSDSEILYGFSDKDTEIILHNLGEQERAEDYVLLAVDLDNASLKIIRKNPWDNDCEEGQVWPYSKFISHVSKYYDGEVKAFYDSISDAGKLREMLDREYMHTFSYRSAFGNRNWINITGYVVARNADGRPATAVMCYSMLDSVGSDRLELKQNLAAALAEAQEANQHNKVLNQIIKAGSWLFRFNDEDEVTGADFSQECAAVVRNDISSPEKWLELIYPDDAERVRIAAMTTMKDRSCRTAFDEEYRIRGKDGEYHWIHSAGRMRRNADGSGELYGICTDIDDIIKRREEEQRQLKRVEDAQKLLTNIVDGYDIVYVVNMADDSLEVRKAAGYTLESGQQFDTFSQAREFLCTRVLHPRDKERLERELSFAVIRERLKEEISYNLEYTSLINRGTFFSELNITSIGNDKIIVGMVKKDMELIKYRLEEKRFAEYFALYVLDLDTEMIRPLKNETSFKILKPGVAVPYAPALQAFAGTVSNPEAREFFMKLAELDYIRRELATDDKRSYTYKSEKFRGKWVKATSYVIMRNADGTPALISIGFNLIDSLDADRQETQLKLRDALETVRHEKNRFEIVKDIINSVEWSFKLSAADEIVSVEYSGDVNRLLDNDLPEGPDAWQTLVHPDDLDAAVKAFRATIADHSGKTPFDINYRMVDRYGNYNWVRSAGRVRREADGSGEFFGIQININQRIEAEQAQYKRLEENMQLIGGLASGYLALYYININAGEFRVYALDEQQLPVMRQMVSEGMNSFGLFQKIGQSDMVHPDDREQFANFNVDTVRRQLAGRKQYSLRFRKRGKNDYRWCEMDVIKFEEADEQANVIAIGIAERDADIRGEQALNQCTSIISKDIAPAEAIAEALAMVGEFYGAERAYIFEVENRLDVFSNTYEWCAAGIKPMKDKLQNVPMQEHSFWFDEIRRYGAFVIDLGGSERDYPKTDIVSEIRRIDSLIVAPIMNGEEITGFVGVDNPSKAKDNIDVLKVVAAVAHNEILKRKQDDEEHITLGKLTEAFLSVYYVDLSRDYMHTWKIDSAYSDAYGAVEHYSVAMGGYVRNNIAANERERCIEMTSPEYVTNQFKNTDRFSIEMTDIMLGYERNVVFDYIKVDETGTKFVACSRDVTETLAREKAQQLLLEAALESAEVANKSKSSFLFNMSHDIRTPMNAITGFTAMAKKYLADKERVADYLDKIDASGQQLLTLVNQVLEMSRIESGKIEFDNRPINVKEKYDSLVTVLSAQAAVNGLEFNSSLKGIRHFNILADEAKMGQITLNITGNALKYTPEGGMVDFSLQEIPCEREGWARFIFTVADTGIGMSEEYLKVLFEPFTREKSSTVSKIQGTGLGMSIVRDLVGLLGGKIEVQSELGKGTRFDITIDFEIAAEKAETENTETREQPASFDGKRVLLVEDNELNREIAKDILEEFGLLVEEADDGDVAVDMVKAGYDRGEYGYYDIVLMDIQMPKLNGYDATRAIREIPGPEGLHLPIIAMTANAFEEDRRNAIAAGMDGHLAKPIDINKLKETLAKFLSA